LIAQKKVRWMNSPDAVWKSEFKPYQLQVTRDVGLRIPKTIISNDPVAIRHAYDEFEQMVVKPSRSGHFRQGDEEYSIYTSLVKPTDIAFVEESRWTPSIYQELVPKRYDIRVTCVGDELFPAAIHSQDDPASEVDWRRTDDPNLCHSHIDLPENIASKLRLLMRRLNLQFGCIDLVLTPAGEYVFLEINPSGQWLWLDDRLDLGISRSIADWLAAS
jgi:glutathione synthase/RimK-type ligase-like ATP-grasp enzyme